MSRYILRHLFLIEGLRGGDSRLANVKTLPHLSVRHYMVGEILNQGGAKFKKKKIFFFFFLILILIFISSPPPA